MKYCLDFQNIQLVVGINYSSDFLTLALVAIGFLLHSAMILSVSSF